jgi:hypothetical protein
VQVREDAAARFNADLDARIAGTVWNTGCASWYVDRTGRNSTLWPDWTWRFRRRTASFDPDDFELTQRTAGDTELVVAVASRPGCAPSTIAGPRLQPHAAESSA